MTLGRAGAIALRYLVERDSILGRGLLFLLQLFSRKARQMRLLPMCWLDQQPAAGEGTLRDGKLETIYGPRFVDGDAKNVLIRLPDLHYREFVNARIGATSSSVISSDGIAIIERIPCKSDTNNVFDYSAGQIFSHGQSSALALLTKPEQIPCGIFMCGNGSFNYFHWLVEILPRIQFFDSLPSNFSKFPLLVNEDAIRIPTFRETLKKFANNLEILLLKNDQTYQINHLIYIDSPSIIPFNLRKNVPYLVDYSFLSSESIQYLRDIALSQTQARTHKDTTLPKKVFFCRKTGNRNYNQDEVSQYLIQLGFENVYMEDFSFDQQVAIAQHAQWIAGPTGAAWTNLIFCQEKTKCLCWMAAEYRDFSAYSTIAGIVGADLLYVQYSANVSSTHDLYTKGYSIDLATIENGLRKLKIL